jgi:hypothetical protein
LLTNKALQISSSTASNLVSYRVPIYFLSGDSNLLSLLPSRGPDQRPGFFPVPKQTRFALNLSVLGLWWRSSQFVWRHTNHSSFCSPKMLPSRPSLHYQWLTPSHQLTGRRVKVLVSRIAFAEACYFPIMLSDFYSSLAGPVIPVVRALTNTHDRQ